MQKEVSLLSFSPGPPCIARILASDTRSPASTDASVTCTYTCLSFCRDAQADVSTYQPSVGIRTSQGHMSINVSTSVSLYRVFSPVRGEHPRVVFAFWSQTRGREEEEEKISCSSLHERRDVTFPRRRTPLLEAKAQEKNGHFPRLRVYLDTHSDTRISYSMWREEPCRSVQMRVNMQLHVSPPYR